MFRDRSNVKIIPDRLFSFDVQTPFHDDISMVTPNLTVCIWITKWSSEHILRLNIGDLKRLLPIIFCTNVESVNQKLHQVILFWGIGTSKQIGLSFLRVKANKKPKKQGQGYLTC